MDSTPTALFESYESDFKHLLEGLKEKLENAGTGGECAAISQCLCGFRACLRRRLVHVLGHDELHYIIHMLTIQFCSFF
jgi:hypothetical protein